MLFIGLNPSTADGERDDPTMRRCMDFARRWGHQSLRVVNLFAFRSPQPKALREADDPVGNPADDEHILEAARKCERILCGWGNWDRGGIVKKRAQSVLQLLEADGHHSKLCCLHVLKQGQPQHPLYVRADQVPLTYPPVVMTGSVPVPGA